MMTRKQMLYQLERLLEVMPSTEADTMRRKFSSLSDYQLQMMVKVMTEIYNRVKAEQGE